MPKINLLLVGDFERGEFRDAVATLQKTATVESVAQLDAAVAALDAGRIAPELIVIAQSYPDQFSEENIDRLRRAAPLARIVGLMGSWCEGEMRTGRPWPATTRLYWHQWPTKCRRQLRRLADGEPCSWSLPPTATEEEKLLIDTVSPLPKGEGTRRGGLTVVRCRSFEAWNWLRETCRSAGIPAVWQRNESSDRVAGATAAIFDCDELNESEIEELQRLSAAVHPARVVVLASFPRIEDYDRALSAGASAVLSKPVTADELVAEIQ